MIRRSQLRRAGHVNVVTDVDGHKVVVLAATGEPATAVTAHVSRRPDRTRHTSGVEGLVHGALVLLSRTDRERYAEEWAADLLDQHGRLRQVGFALGVIYSATRLALRRALAFAKG